MKSKSSGGSVMPSPSSERKRRNVCVLVSGGVDSCVLLGWMATRFDEVYPVYVRCGLRWEGAELHWLNRFLREFQRRLRQQRKKRAVLHPLGVLQMPVSDLYGSHWSLRSAPRRAHNRQSKECQAAPVPDRASDDREVYLPGRNLLLLAKAAVFCATHDVSTIAMGQLKGNPFPDATQDFLSSAERTIGAAMGRRIRILTPFLALRKPDVVRKGKRLGLPLELSFSCLAPGRGYRACGRCNKCAEWDRIVGLLSPKGPPRRRKPAAKNPGSDSF